MLGSLSLITVFQMRLIWQLSSQNMLNTSYSITLRSPIPFPPCEYFLIGHYNLEALHQKQIISDYLLVLRLVLNDFCLLMIKWKRFYQSLTEARKICGKMLSLKFLFKMFAILIYFLCTGVNLLDLLLWVTVKFMVNTKS